MVLFTSIELQIVDRICFKIWPLFRILDTDKNYRKILGDFLRLCVSKPNFKWKDI